ncbi:MAG: radical SAM protein [Candidatus Zixiibacteriota bacterium]|nr:MAG: radical SAM protein [candidate division Zixibacteria bacterium]
MARFALVQNLLTENLGLMYLSAYLQRQGHDARIFIDVRGTNALAEVEAYGPTVLGFSCTTGLHHWALDFARRYKARHPEVTVLLGGPHPTFYPQIVEDPVVDFVCVGEGEEATAELGSALDGGDVTRIANLWGKAGGQVFSNPVRPLLQNLDALPFPDRTYYDRYPITARETSKNFISGRGCAFKCNFCANHTLQELYRGKGRYVRFRSQENVIEEIRQVRSRWPVRFVGFSDDILIVNKKWLFPFLNLYKRDIGLPFLSTVRANLVDEEIVSALKEAGCISCVFGVESGVERIRNEVLAKGVSDEDIYEAARLFKKYKIRFGTYNMVGLPGETVDDAFQTVKINAKIRADFPWCSVLQPYPGTQIRRRIEAELGKELPVDEIGASYFTTSVVRGREIRELENLQKFFHLAVRVPLLQPLIRRLIKLPPNPAFQVIFQACYAWQLMRRSRINFFKLVQYGLASSRLFQKSPAKEGAEAVPRVQEKRA